MINVSHFIFVVVLLLTSHHNEILAAQNCSDVKLDPACSPTELLAYLTHPCFYDKHTSPLHGFNKSETDRINFKLHVYYFKQKPGPTLTFNVHLLVQIRWHDPRLRYKHKISTIPQITGEKHVLHQIWSPYIYLANERSGLIRSKLNKDLAVHILPDGTVLYTSRLITQVSCWVKLGRFPMDKQKCHLTIDTWKFQSGDLELKWENDTAAVTISQEASFLAEYRLTDTIFFTDFQFSEPDHIGGHQYNCSSLTVVFYVSRNYGFYLMNYYVPSVLLVVISWVSFWEAPDALPGRTLLGTGTMLTFMTLGVEVSKSLPTVPYIRSNDLWFFGCTAFIFCSLAEFAFVNTLWRYGGEVELKKATSKYILKSSLGARAPETMRFGRRRSLSCPSSPTTRWENPLKRVVNNELTVKSLSDLEISLPLSELKTRRKETFEITEKPPDPPTTMKMQEIAVWIDKKSRLAFPICFSLFNCVYWTLLLVS